MVFLFSCFSFYLTPHICVVWTNLNVFYHLAVCLMHCLCFYTQESPGGHACVTIQAYVRSATCCVSVTACTAHVQPIVGGGLRCIEALGKHKIGGSLLAAGLQQQGRAPSILLLAVEAGLGVRGTHACLFSLLPDPPPLP